MGQFISPRSLEPSSVDLADARWKAAECSGGTSGEPIKRMVLRCLDQAGAEGPLLDFGAGKGELLRRLREERSIRPLAGADLMARPSDLPPDIAWLRQDLNEPLSVGEPFGTVICSETIEHLENPRATFRTLTGLLRPEGLLVLTMPNQESLRSYFSLAFGGHFVHFQDGSYPAHITALLRLDLVRICAETGLMPPSFYYSDVGQIPKLTRLTWQQVSGGLLRGRLFSENLAMVARKAPELPIY